jgi:hypothetical protein
MDLEGWEIWVAGALLLLLMSEIIELESTTHASPAGLSEPSTGRSLRYLPARIHFRS